MDQIGLKEVFCTKNSFLFFAEILFAEHMLSEEIIPNVVSLGESPAIDFGLYRNNAKINFFVN